jgi:hypothetical protein
MEEKRQVFAKGEYAKKKGCWARNGINPTLRIKGPAQAFCISTT